eukprot:Hpha_TRINITY_DN16472_c0_g4::TRINITY_DN16472_c0_g4_i5::g.160663::m.160663
MGIKSGEGNKWNPGTQRWTRVLRTLRCSFKENKEIGNENKMRGKCLPLFGLWGTRRGDCERYEQKEWSIRLLFSLRERAEGGWKDREDGFLQDARDVTHN